MDTFEEYLLDIIVDLEMMEINKSYSSNKEKITRQIEKQVYEKILKNINNLKSKEECF